MKKHKLKTLCILLVPFILLTIIISAFYNSINVYAAEDTNEQTLIMNIQDYYDSGNGWGPYSGTFEIKMDLPDNYVFFYIQKYDSNGNPTYKQHYYGWLQNGSYANNYYINVKGSNQNCTYGTWNSDTVDNSNNSNIKALFRHYDKAFMYGELVYSSLPYFSSWESAVAYLEQGIADPDTMINYDDVMTVEAPEFDSIYMSDNNIYKYYINLIQNIGSLNGFNLAYKIDIDVNCSDYQYVSSNTYYTDILAKQNMIFDMSNYISDGSLNTETDYKRIKFTFYNTNTERNSEECTIEINYDMYGVYYILGGFPNLEYPQPYNEFKTLSDIVVDYWSPEGSGSSGIWQGSSSDGGGFISTVINGFGLNGDSGLLSLFSMMFSFIPSSIWDMLMVFIGACIIVALFKLVIH